MRGKIKRATVARIYEDGPNGPQEVTRTVNVGEVVEIVSEDEARTLHRLGKFELEASESFTPQEGQITLEDIIAERDRLVGELGEERLKFSAAVDQGIQIATGSLQAELAAARERIVELEEDLAKAQDRITYLAQVGLETAALLGKQAADSPPDEPKPEEKREVPKPETRDPAPQHRDPAPGRSRSRQL